MSATASRLPPKVSRRVAAWGIGALLVTLAAWLSVPDLASRARETLFDTYQRAAPRPYVDAPVKVVDIDDASLTEHGQWPWPRWKLARLVDQLTEAGAVVVAFDVVFPEPDRSSPARILADAEARGGGAVPDVPALASLDYDADLAAAFARGRVVTGYPLVASDRLATPPPKAATATVGTGVLDGMASFPGAIPNIAVLDAAAAGSGVFSVLGQGGAIIRETPVLYRSGDRAVPSLALEALRVAQGASTVAIRRDAAEGKLALRVGEAVVSVPEHGAQRIRFTGPAAARTLTAGEVLAADPAALAERVEGQIVLIGSSAAGLADLRPTPLNPFEPGVNLHAMLLEQTLLGIRLERPIWAMLAEVAVALVAGLLAVLAVVMLGAGAGLGVAVAAGGLAAGGSVWAFSTQGLLLDPLPLALSGVLAASAAAYARFSQSEKARRQIRTAFAQYLSPDLVNTLVADPQRLALGGERRDMTFLFTDIAGFTSLTEKLDPETLVSVLNRYLDGVCAIVMRHGGAVDKIVGDAVHAMFNAPLDQEDHAARAVAAALEIDRFAEGLRAEFNASGIPFGITRIGVNTGPAIVGNFGGESRFDYTAHGDSINTAARLESANAHFGTRVCVADSVLSPGLAIALRPIGDIVLKGKSVPVRVHEPLATADPDYAAAFAALEAGAAEATARFEALHQARPGDGLVAFHADRLARGDFGTVITLSGK